MSLAVSAGLGYYGCRKRKKKQDDDASDSGRALSFAPALSTTADMFPWPATPSHQTQPSGSPHAAPAAGELAFNSAYANSGAEPPQPISPHSMPAGEQQAFASASSPNGEGPASLPGPSSSGTAPGASPHTRVTAAAAVAAVSQQEQQADGPGEGPPAALSGPSPSLRPAA